jgi:hypothetical protein
MGTLNITIVRVAIYRIGDGPIAGNLFIFVDDLYVQLVQVKGTLDRQPAKPQAL